MAYVGNRSRDLQNTSGGAGSNINLVPLGAMLTAQPIQGMPMPTNTGLCRAMAI